MRLTNDEIERFVLIVKDVTFLSMYGQLDNTAAASIMQNLALLRSDLIIPPLLER